MKCGGTSSSSARKEVIHYEQKEIVFLSPNSLSRPTNSFRKGPYSNYCYNPAISILQQGEAIVKPPLSIVKEEKQAPDFMLRCRNSIYVRVPALTQQLPNLLVVPVIALPSVYTTL